MGKTAGGIFVPTEGKEYMLYASKSKVKDLGTVELYLNTAGNIASRFTAGKDTLSVAGEKLYLVNTVPLGSPSEPTANEVVISVSGTTTGTSTTTTGSRAFAMDEEYGMMLVVLPNVATELWKTVSNISVTSGGAAGDSFILIAMPEDSTFNFIEHHTNFSIPTPFALEPHGHRYNSVVCYHRTRANVTLSIGSKESHPDAVIRNIIGREVVLKFVNQLGGVSDNYLIYADKVVLNGTLDVPEDGVATYNVEGSFSRYMIPKEVTDWPI